MSQAQPHHQQPQPRGGGGVWEGLGGPIRMEEPNGSNRSGAWLDPTLDTCCQRDMQERAQFGALQRTLRRFDVTAERERRRRHLVQLLPSSSSSSSHGNTNTNTTNSRVGCRCLYDPQVDGGEYAALTTLRATRAVSETNRVVAQKEHLLLDDEPLEENKDKEEQSQNNDDNNNNGEEDDEFDYLLDEEIPGQESEAVQTWQETRRMEMEAMLLCQEVEEYHGYGMHCQFHPRRVAAVVGLERGRLATTPPPVVVLHLYESESMASAWLDLYLEQFAAQARGTLFVRSHGRGTLVQEAAGQLQAHLQAQSDLPALVLVKQGIVVTAVPNLRDFLVDDSPEEEHKPCLARDALEHWLFQSGALDHKRPPDYETLCRMRPEEEALMDSLRVPAAAREQEDTYYYDCGLPGCQKTFAHEHVGISTEQQDGLVVSVDQVLGTESI